LLRKAGELADSDARRVTSADLGKVDTTAQEAHFVNIGVIRAGRGDRVEYTVPVEGAGSHSAALPANAAHN